jgi:hypothetical protein
MKKHVPPRVEKFPAAKQRRLDQLLEKNREGTITSKEKGKLEQLVEEAQQLMISNAKRLAQFSHSEAVRPPAAAVPVTIWVQPEQAER